MAADVLIGADQRGQAEARIRLCAARGDAQLGMMQAVGVETARPPQLLGTDAGAPTLYPQHISCFARVSN